MDIVDQRVPLCVAAHQLAAAGTSLSTGGNLSVRVGDRVLVTPSGARLGAVQPDQLVVVNMDGSVIEETRYRPTAELRFHLDLYRSTSASAIAHAHPLASVAVSTITELLPPIHYDAAMVGGSIRVAPYAVFGSPELSEGVVAALFERTAALMRNHGSVAIGGNIETACEHLGVVEWLSEVYLKAVSAGAPAILSDDQLTEVVATAARRAYQPYPGRDR
ncbi:MULTISPECIES: class II aldolase/adducin family protein [Gordonia]|uniref:L-fuculose-phosphate aldolase n=1 Tax=Gordonia sputi NBRC 100414 TaxID=1089453 RepID=H5U2W4_9ACTN|nr:MULTISPECIES: class II aldolase/adducin family protein [Gordonia]NKY95913.1 class II aldolase/adducin family protein [Gordonia sputi]OBA38144.1 fructose-bisphosphate aldolase [Gordonia sp. 852002-51296_SCH5728562-b]GAB40072.1 L-fuculose-phosphate aldolase [Gordonia sputi NBRC 100414]